MNFELTTSGGKWSYYHIPEITAAGIIHGFMTASSDAITRGVPERADFVKAVGGREAVSLQQEHGDVVHVIATGERPHAGDGLIVIEKKVVGIVKTADCLPVILYDTGCSMAAVIHAGWRGTVAFIVEKVVTMMIDKGAHRSSMGALLGPGIGQCCYQVGPEVARIFHERGFEATIFERKGSSLFLDLKKANRNLLERAGIGAIHDINLCTKCTQHMFHSARRDKGQGRQINFVLIGNEV
jgi:polyphenol oxidase